MRRSPEDKRHGQLSRCAAGLLGVIAVVIGAARVHAKLCGDDVQGVDVPCACGDVVVSDVVLTDDPVTLQVCAADGLIVRAVDAARGVTVNLNGHILHGSGQGAGVWVVFGGPGGARLISQGAAAQLDGFRDGVVAQGSDSVALIGGIVAIRSRRDGIRVDAPNYAVQAATAQDSGRDGFSLRGRNFQVLDTQARHSGRFGYFVMGVGGIIGAAGAGNTSDVSGESGFNVDGAWHSLTDCHVSSATKDGVRLNGSHYAVSGCVAQGNGRNGIVGAGVDWYLNGNRALQNGNDGLVVRGLGVVDGGNNTGSANLGLNKRQTVTQCTVNGLPCRL